MGVLPTTFLREPDVFKEAVRGLANAQMGILLNQMKLGNLKVSQRLVRFDSGLEILCQVNYNAQTIHVTLPPVEEIGEIIKEEYLNGFLCHPHETPSGYDLHNAGDAGKFIWHNASSKWDTRKGASERVTYDTKGNRLRGGDYFGNKYGNVDWKGPKLKKSDGSVAESQQGRLVVTWKGQPSRYWSASEKTEIVGITVMDHILTGDLSPDDYYYTPFGNTIYEHGQEMAKTPDLYFPIGSNGGPAQVLGAAKLANGKYVCVVKTCYNQFPRPKNPQEMVDTWRVDRVRKVNNEDITEVWSYHVTQAEADEEVTLQYNAELAANNGWKFYRMKEADPGRGYFIEVLVGWGSPYRLQMKDHSSGWHSAIRFLWGMWMPKTNWFFSEDGLKAVTVDGSMHEIALTWNAAINNYVGIETVTAGGTFSVDVNTTRLSVTTDAAALLTTHDKMPLVWTTEGWTAGQFFAYEEDDPGYAIYTVPLVGAVGPTNAVTDTYADTRSGTIIVAADYDGLELVKLTAVLTGEQTINKYHYYTDAMYGRCLWLEGLYDYGQYSYKAYRTGTQTDQTFDLALATMVTLKCPTMNDLPVFTRNRTKNTAFHRYFYAAEAVIPELTSNYASYPYGSDFTTTGSYTYVQECLDTEIRYADLRIGTLHVRQDHKTTNASASNNDWIGAIGVLCYGAWYGGEDGFMSIGVKDAVGLIFDYIGTALVEEKIIQPLADNPTMQELMNTSTGTSSVPFACAASDRTGWSGGLAFDTFAWGTYEVVDTDYPWNPSSGDYVSKYKVDNLEAFYMEYEDTAPRYRTMDARDEEIFNLYFGGNSTATVTYPLPLVITPELPTSSMAHDVDGNCFYSVLADNNLVYNKLITTGDTEDPKIVTKNEGLKSTYYPVAPV